MARSLEEIFGKKSEPVVLTRQQQDAAIADIFQPQQTQRRPLANIFSQNPQPKNSNKSFFDDISTGGGNVLTERGIGIIQLLDEATGGALLSPKAREASYKAMQNIKAENEDLGAAGIVASFTADPLMLLPAAKALKGAKALAAGGAVAAGTANAISGKTSEKSDRLADIAMGYLTGAITGPLAGKATEYALSPVKTAKNIGSVVGKALKVSPEYVQKFEEAGLNPLIGDVSKSTRVQRLQNLSEDAPLIGAITTRAKENLSSDVRKKLTEIGFDENAERVIGGDAAKTGLTNYISKGKTLFDKAFERFDKKYLSKNESTNISSTLGKINEIYSRAKTPEALDAYLSASEKKIIEGIQGAAESGNASLSYNDLKLFRTSIGKKLEDYTIGSSEKAILRELYGSLTEDMRNKAMSKGTSTLEAFDRLNNHYSSFISNIDNNINKVLSKGENTQIFNAIRSGLPLPEQTKRIMSAMPQKERDILRGSLIKELGTDRTKVGQGEFEVGKFITSFNALDKKAQSALLTGLPKDVQVNFKKVIDAGTLALKTGLQSNASGTAKNVGLMALIGSMIKAPITTTSGLTGGAITAKMMTNPRFIKWLANAPNVTESNKAKYIAKLSSIALSDIAIEDDVKSLEQILKNQPVNLPTTNQ